MWSSPVTFGGGTQITNVSSRRAPAPAAYSPSASHVSCQRRSTLSGEYCGSMADESKDASGADYEDGARRVREEPPLAVLEPRLGRHDRATAVDERADAADDARLGRDRPREVRLQLQRRPAGPRAGDRDEHRSHRRVEQRRREPGVHRADRVVVLFARDRLPHDPPRLDLGEARPEELRDGRVRKLAGEHPPEELEPVEPGGDRERLVWVGPAERARARLRHGRVAQPVPSATAPRSSSSSGTPCVTSVGLMPFAIVSFVITHLETSRRDGSSNITSSSAPSMIERRPRAPVSRSSALSPISHSASSVKTSSTVS